MNQCCRRVPQRSPCVFGTAAKPANSIPRRKVYCEAFHKHCHYCQKGDPILKVRPYLRRLWQHRTRKQAGLNILTLIHCARWLSLRSVLSLAKRTSLLTEHSTNGSPCFHVSVSGAFRRRAQSYSLATNDKPTRISGIFGNPMGADPRFTPLLRKPRAGLNGGVRPSPIVFSCSCCPS